MLAQEVWGGSRKSSFLEVFQLTLRTTGLAESTENSKKTRIMVLAYPLAKGELLFILPLLSSLVYFGLIIVVTIIYTLTWSPLKISINTWYSFIFLPLKIQEWLVQLFKIMTDVYLCFPFGWHLLTFSKFSSSLSKQTSIKEVPWELLKISSKVPIWFLDSFHCFRILEFFFIFFYYKSSAN